MTMLGDLFNGIVGYTRLIDPSYWTLTIELIFYIGIGVFVHYFSDKNIRYFFGCWIIVSMIAFALGVEHNFYVKLLLVGYTSYFTFGGALALIALHHAKNAFEKYFDWTLLFVSASYAVYIHPRALEPYYVVNQYDTSIITVILILFFITIPILVYLSPRIKNARMINALAVVGGMTYPLYLLHQRIGNATMNFVIAHYNVSWTHLSIGFEVVMICLSYIVYVQDKKMRGWLRLKMFAREPKI
jgi:peptidoglycan/LPS O-acetylase OafA/YrhL